MKRNLVSMMLALAMCMTLCVPAFAYEENEKPIPIVGEDSGEPMIENAGALSPEEIQDRLSQPVTRGYSRVTEGVAVTRTYNGTRDRGEVESGYNDKTEKDTMPFSISQTISNSFDLGLGYTSKKNIEAKVGYSLSWSDTRTFGYNATVSPKHTTHIEMVDCYHVSELHTWQILEVWVGNSTTPTTTRKDDYDAWSAQWYKAHFSSWEEPGNHAV